MKRLVFTIACVAIIAQTARAGDSRSGLMGTGGGGFGGLGFGGWHDTFSFHGFGPFGFGVFGYGGFNTERLQMHFENRFEDLMTEYDTGLADIEDFFNSDEYADVVGDVGRLVDRYDLFLSGAERTADRLGDFIAIATDDLTFYTDLLAEYEAREDLPEHRLERIIARLTNVQDHLTMKIDLLTEKQTTLSENLGSYQTFSDDLATYLAEIVAAGGGATMDAGQIASQAFAATSALAAMPEEVFTLTEGSPLWEAPHLQSAVAATAVPEPCAGLLFAVAAAALVVHCAPRSGRRRRP